MTIDMSRYKECPHCHTFQGFLLPCRKCGYNIATGEVEYRQSKQSIYVPVKSTPGPKATPKAHYYRSHELAMLRALQDGKWHSIKQLKERGIVKRWYPAGFTWQTDLISRGIIGFDKIPDRCKNLSVRIIPDRMQDARKLMEELEADIHVKDECGKTEL